MEEGTRRGSKKIDRQIDEEREKHCEGERESEF